MPSVDIFTFSVPDPLRPGRTYRTRYKMTPEDAARNHPGAVAQEGSREMRTLGVATMGHGAAAEIVAAGGGGHQQWRTVK